MLFTLALSILKLQYNAFHSRALYFKGTVWCFSHSRSLFKRGSMMLFTLALSVLKGQYDAFHSRALYFKGTV
jgi:hypothetical protein